jgi:hypothetical protein
LDGGNFAPPILDDVCRTVIDCCFDHYSKLGLHSVLCRNR